MLLQVSHTSCIVSHCAKNHHHNRFTALFPGPAGWAGARRELLDFMVQGKIDRGRHTDHPDGRHSIRTNQCPPPLNLGAAQSSIFGSARIFSARSAGLRRKLRLNSNHAPEVNARPYWSYNRPITPMYEHLCCHLRRGLIICCVCESSNVPTADWGKTDNRLTIDQCTMTQNSNSYIIMLALCNRADHYIFMLWFVLSSSSFFPCLISAAADWMSVILPHMVWP